MKTKKNGKAIEILSQNELALTKGGEERDYIIVIINGRPMKIYV